MNQHFDYDNTFDYDNDDSAADTGDTIPSLLHFGGQGYPYFSYLRTSVTGTVADDKSYVSAALTADTADELLHMLDLERDCVETNSLATHLPVNFRSIFASEVLSVYSQRECPTQGGAQAEVACRIADIVFAFVSCRTFR